jgi:sortase A
MNSIDIVKKLNLLTSILILFFCVVILIQPHLPEIIFELGKNKYEGYVYNSESSIKKLGSISKELPSIPKDNRLVIPSIYVNAPINEGDNLDDLKYGMLRRPNTSTPIKGGNTVVIGHRRQYTSGPLTFYNLDKLKVNDILLVYWEGREYEYKVFEIFEVNPDRVDIEDNTIESILTLYTCTPLWTSERRLVVKAKLL